MKNLKSLPFFTSSGKKLTGALFRANPVFLGTLSRKHLLHAYHAAAPMPHGHPPQAAGMQHVESPARVLEKVSPQNQKCFPLQHTIFVLHQGLERKLLNLHQE